MLILGILAARGTLPAFRAALGNRRLVLPLAGSAVMIAINWLTYVWAVNDNHVLAASLGYFLNPLVNVLLGVLVLKERLRRAQLLAIAVAAAGVAILAASALTTLWISLTLAFSFAFYGLINRHIPFLLELRFGDAIGKSGARCYLLCHGLGQRQRLIANAVEKSPPFTLCRCHGLTRIKQLAGSTLTDNPR